jgi:hypothetical protein
VDNGAKRQKAIFFVARSYDSGYPWQAVEIL